MHYETTHHQLSACELMNKPSRIALLLLALFIASPAFAQEHKPVPNKEGAAQAPVAAETVKDAHDGTRDAAQPGEHAVEGEHAEEHSVWAGLLWPTVNFAILVGGLWWFLRDPAAAYLRDRHMAIRRDLVEAANVKAAAAAQLEEIDRKLKALPGEIEALRTRGAEEIAAEEQRIAALAVAERDRLLEQTRREIALQLRLAKRELVEHAAELSVQLAGERIQKHITPADQTRLVDRYLEQVKRPS